MPISMRANLRKKLLLSAAGCLVALLLLIPSDLRLAAIDDPTDSYFSQAMFEAAGAYTTCRLLNASVSVVKESSLQLEPAGVGVSIAVGQVLDPIDDMTERLSNILVTAITSIGVQKLLYEISISVAMPILSCLILFSSLLIWFNHAKVRSLTTFVLKLSLLLLVARVCLPLSALVNTSIHGRFFAVKIEAALQQLSIGSAELEKLGEISLPEFDGVLGTIENSSTLLKKKTTELKSVLKITAGNMATIVEALLKLSYLYIGMFLFQIVFLPLLAFWVLVKTGNTLFNVSVPVIISQNSDREV